jgi:hypothetical protein
MSVSFTFLDRTQLDIVAGGEDRIRRMLSPAFTLPLSQGAYALVFYEPDAAEHRAFLLDTFGLTSLQVELLGGAELSDVLERVALVPLILPGAQPDGPAVVVDANGVAGAWVSPLPEAAPLESPMTAEPDVRREAAPKGLRRGLDRGLGSGLTRGGDAPWNRDVSSEDASGAPAADADSGHGDATIRRTPHIDAPDDLPTLPGTTFAVRVYTDTGALHDGEVGIDVVIDAPADVHSVPIGVLLIVTDHFSVEGDEYQVLTIARDETDGVPLEFTVTVAERPPDGRAGIQALFLYRGRTCGQVGREWEWPPGATRALAVEPTGAAPTSLPIHLDAQAPDLSVFITAPVNDQMNFKCAVETPLIPGCSRATVTSFGLPMRARDYVSEKLADLTDPSATPAQRRTALGRIGFELWDAAPQLFKDVLWELVDCGEKPKTVYIASAEPNLPWELMIPNRPPKEGRLTELRPLGVEFAVGRWTRADSESPPQRIPVRDSFIVAPDYPGTKKLNSDRERSLLEKAFNGALVHPATVEHLSDFFTRNHASLLHLACHGEAGIRNDDALALEGGEMLLAGDVRADPGFRSLCASSGPFVFLNACETGQVVPALGGGAGFPFAFAMIGARAIVAPLWPVDDRLAQEVACEVYAAALADDAPPVAEIVRQIRARAYAEPGADTYAAYCFYGDPLARIEKVAAQGASPAASTNALSDSRRGAPPRLTDGHELADPTWT